MTFPRAATSPSSAAGRAIAERIVLDNRPYAERGIL
jgi:hypothetical protein